MKHFYPTLLLSIFFSILGTQLGHGQTYNGSISLTTQAAVDSFGAIGYSHITEDLLIGDTLNTQSSDISDISSLMSLKSIGSSLFVRNNNLLQGLIGLDSITHLGNGLIIAENDSLLSLNHIGNIDSLDLLVITECPELPNLNGLESITYISGRLLISYNNSLTSLSGLHNMENIEGRFYINDNLIINSFSGLEGLKHIGGEFLIMFNHNLESLSGLDNLISVGSALRIILNASLETLTGLESFNTINLANPLLNISSNSSLIDFCALTNFIDNGNYYNITSSNYFVTFNDYNPTQSQLEFGVCNSTLSIDNNNLTSTSLTPNPTVGNLQIDLGLSESNTIRVINQLGQIVYKANNISSPIYNFNLDGPKGIYTVEVFSDEFKKQFKVVKL